MLSRLSAVSVLCVAATCLVLSAAAAASTFWTQSASGTQSTSVTQSGSGAQSTSGAQLWTALHGDVVCGIAIHPPNTPPIRLLCSAKPVPAPTGTGVGDPGFVFLGSTGRPSRARLSQDSFTGTSPVTLKAGRTWTGGPVHVTCAISATTVKCTNSAHHGFTITTHSYAAF